MKALHYSGRFFLTVLMSLSLLAFTSALIFVVHDEFRVIWFWPEILLFLLVLLLLVVLNDDTDYSLEGAYLS